MKTPKMFYIGERFNPQLPKPYYNAYGKLTKKEALKKENCAYGTILLTVYETCEKYEQAKAELISKGFTVNNNEKSEIK